MISLTINGNKVSAPKGSTILEAARSAGINIPTLCWLEKISPTGACRICAVEVDGVDRTLTACNTAVKEGISVTTDSERLSSIRADIMKLMLVNHPLDCPVCDAGGECGLQDTCYALSVTSQDYTALLERKPIRYDWNLLESDPNRCILCEKCVKVDHEIVGCDAIHVVNRGDDTIIDTKDGKPLDCDFCGNCIEACPTGTLISKPFKFMGRPWTFTPVEGICSFCSVGCQVTYHVRDGKIGRVTSDDSTYNNGNLCINGRFGYSSFNSSARISSPEIKGADGTRVSVPWESALASTAAKLKEIVTEYGPESIAAIGSPRLSNEESFLFQKFMREYVGTSNIDSEAGFGYSASIDALSEITGFKGATKEIREIDSSDLIFVFGSDPKSEATGYEYHIIKAVTKNDANLIVASNRNIKLKKYANSYLTYNVGAEISLLAALTKAILASNSIEAEPIISSLSLNLSEYSDKAGVDPEIIKSASSLISKGKKISILVGADIISSKDNRAIIEMLGNLTRILAIKSGEAPTIYTTDEKNNMLGMLEMGFSPAYLPGWKKAAKKGKNITEILEGIEKGEIKALYVAAADPVSSFQSSERFRQAFQKLDFLLVQSICNTATSELADVILPAAAAPEKSGSFTSPDGRVNTFKKASEAPEGAKSDFEIFSNLISLFGGSVTASIQKLRNEIAEATEGLYSLDNGLSRTFAKSSTVIDFTICPPLTDKKATQNLLRVSSKHHNGTMTSFSENNLSAAKAGFIEISPDDAKTLGINDNDRIKVESKFASITSPAKISVDNPKGLLTAPSNFPSMNISALFGTDSNLVEVKISKSA